jgi:hypothetical protein
VLMQRHWPAVGGGRLIEHDRLLHAGLLT